MPFFGTYSTSFSEKYRTGTDLYENEFPPPARTVKPGKKTKPDAKRQAS